MESRRRKLKRWRDEERSNLKHWRAKLIEKLEAVHNLAVDADAFHSARETVSENMSWPSDGDPERRRAMNHLGCLSDELSRRLDALLRESQEAVELAMKRAG